MKKFYALTLFLIMFCSQINGQGTICRTKYINGTLDLQKIGKNLVGKTNTSKEAFNQIKVYITLRERKLHHFYKDLNIPAGTSIDDTLKHFDASYHNEVKDLYALHKNGYTSIYVYSNYQTQEFKFPTKLFYSVDEIGLDIYEYFRNLVFHPKTYVETLDLSNKLREAITSQIDFFIDHRIFSHPKTKGLDISGIKNITLVNKSGVVIPNGYETLINQKALQKLGWYKDTIDGLDGSKTKAALADFKDDIGLQKFQKVSVKFSENKSKITFEDPNDFIRYLDDDNFSKCSLEFCITEKEATITGECPNVSLEVSTKGEITATLSQGNTSYDVVLNDGQKTEDTPNCNVGAKLCFSKKINETYSINCGEQSISLSSGGTTKFSSGNLSTTF